MRIAYITSYQGPGLVKKRPCQGNLSLAARVKIELIAELLQRSSHSVEIISQGEVVERILRFYPGYREAESFDPNVPVFYSSALPVRFVNGLWSSWSTLNVFKTRHRLSPFDVVVIYNLKRPQIACANYAIRRLGLPVILEYEDDAFSNIWGQGEGSFNYEWQRSATRNVLRSASACAAVSPYLLSQLPESTPKLLLRGVVGHSILNYASQTNGSRKNWVVFSGTLEDTQGTKQLVRAWRELRLPDWELHIAGQGPAATTLRQLAEGSPNIVFHGLLNREQNAHLLCAAKIGMNPQDLTQTPGNVFAFKIIEYLAAGLHVITTPRGNIEKELETGITYISDNSPEKIGATLKHVIESRLYEQTSQEATVRAYGPAAVSKALDALIEQATATSRSRNARSL